MSRRLASSVAALCSIVAGCRFEADFRGTHFACGDVEPRCPPAQACIDGVCVVPTPPDAGRTDAATDELDAAATTVDAPGLPDGPPAIAPGLEAAADATLDAAVPTHNHGVALDLVVRNAAPRATAVVRFDLSAIAPGTLIAHATLHVAVPAGGEDDAVVEVHRVLEAWQEGVQLDAGGAASWRDRKDGAAWSGEGAQGGSRGADVMGTITASGAGAYAVPLDVATVQAWVTSPTNNNGVVLVPVSGSALRLGSRNGDLATRPRLELTFLTQ